MEDTKKEIKEVYCPYCGRIWVFNSDIYEENGMQLTTCPICAVTIQVPTLDGELQIKIEGNSHIHVQEVLQRTYNNIVNKNYKEIDNMDESILIVAALEHELDAIFKYLGSPFEIKKVIKNDRIYYIYQKNSGFKVICACSFGMGQLDAAILVKDAITTWNVKKVILTGICGGLDKSIALGDIVVSDQIVDYELGKITPENKIIRWNVFRSDYSLLNELRNYRDDSWYSYIREQRPDKNISAKPAIHFGTVLSGNKVIASEEEADSLKSIWNKAYAIEMEASGIAAVLRQTPNPPAFIMVKSVCDYADNEKNDNWQSYSADASAAFIISYILSNYHKKEVILETQKEGNYEYRNLRFVISEAYSLTDLNILAFDMNIDIEDIPGSSKSEKVIELIKYCKRRNSLSRLIELINRDRNNILEKCVL